MPFFQKTCQGMPPVPCQHPYLKDLSGLSQCDYAIPKPNQLAAMKIAEFQAHLHEVITKLKQLESIANIEDYPVVANRDVSAVRETFKEIYSRLLFLSGGREDWLRASSGGGVGETGPFVDDTTVGDIGPFVDDTADTSVQIHGDTLPGVVDTSTADTIANDNSPPVESSPNTKLRPRPTFIKNRKQIFPISLIVTTIFGI